MLFKRLLAAAALALASTAPLAAAELVQATPDLAQIVASMKRAGYSADIETTASGGAKIKSMILGIPFFVTPTGCGGGPTCKAIYFAVGSPTNDAMTLPSINQLNEGTVASKAVISDLNGAKVLVFKMAVVTEGGVTDEVLRASLNIWRLDFGNLLKAFSRQ